MATHNKLAAAAPVKRGGTSQTRRHEGSTTYRPRGRSRGIACCANTKTPQHLIGREGTHYRRPGAAGSVRRAEYRGSVRYLPFSLLRARRGGQRKVAKNVMAVVSQDSERSLAGRAGAFRAWVSTGCVWPI